jgi:glycosyltransferase involved in cell wall biosynthesis
VFSTRVCIFGSEIGWVKKGVFVGGATVSAVRLGQALHSLGHEVFVFSSAPRDKPSGVYTLDWGVIVNKRILGRYMSLPNLLLFGLVSFFGLLQFCKRNKIEVINSHSGSVMLCVVPSFVGRLLGIPVVHTQYCELTSKAGSFDKVLGFFTPRVSMFAPSKFVGISKNVSDSLLVAAFPRQKVVMIPPVVPVSAKRARSKIKYRHALGFGGSDSIVLFVGNLKRNKGVDVLFEAFIGLAQALPTLKLVVTIELVHENLLERKKSLQDRLMQHGLADRVVWLGFVDDVLGLMREVDVVVVPFLDLKGISDYPLVVLEAMSVGTPVIATDVGGTREVLCEGAGILVPPSDVDALSKGLLSIMANKEKYNTGHNACGLFLDYFDANVLGRKYQQLFLREVNKVD